MLAGHVCCPARKPYQAGRGSRINDGAAAVFQHLRYLVLHTQEHPGQVDCDDPCPILFAAISDIDWLAVSHLALDTGVVKGAVQPAVSLDGPGDHGFDLLADRDIGFDEQRFAACILDHSYRLLATITVVIGDRDFRTFACEDDRGGAANSRTTPGDQHYLPRNSTCHFAAPCVFCQFSSTITDRYSIPITECASPERHTQQIDHRRGCGEVWFSQGAK